MSPALGVRDDEPAFRVRADRHIDGKGQAPVRDRRVADDAAELQRAGADGQALGEAPRLDADALRGAGKAVGRMDDVVAGRQGEVRGRVRRAGDDARLGHVAPVLVDPPDRPERIGLPSPAKAALRRSDDLAGRGGRKRGRRERTGRPPRAHGSPGACAERGARRRTPQRAKDENRVDFHRSLVPSEQIRPARLLRRRLSPSARRRARCSRDSDAAATRLSSESGPKFELDPVAARPGPRRRGRGDLPAAAALRSPSTVTSQPG